MSIPFLYGRTLQPGGDSRRNGDPAPCRRRGTSSRSDRPDGACTRRYGCRRERCGCRPLPTDGDGSPLWCCRSRGFRRECCHNPQARRPRSRSCSSSLPNGAWRDRLCRCSRLRRPESRRALPLLPRRGRGSHIRGQSDRCRSRRAAACRFQGRGDRAGRHAPSGGAS